MGITSRNAIIQAAERYAGAVEKQQKLLSEQNKGEAQALYGEALMIDARRDFLAPADRSFLESIIEDSDLMPLRYLALGQLAAAAVGRVYLQVPDGSGSGFATGFLVAPGLMLTNWHVLESPKWARGATLTLDSEDDVDGIPKPPRVFRLNPNRLFLADSELDFCFVAVEPRAIDGTPLSRYGYLRLFPSTGKILRNEYATIIQHPNGRQKHLASRNNKITTYVYDTDLDAAERAANNFLYYSTDTLKGSSGSPVFSDQWYVVALHRRGVPATRTVRGRKVIVRTNGRVAAADDPDEVIRYLSNEGVRVSRILARVAEISVSEDERAEAAGRTLEAVNLAAGSVENGPVAKPTARISILDERSGSGPGAEIEDFELVRRRLSKFPEDTGYDPDFLPGFTIPLPEPRTPLRTELAPRLDKPDTYLLPFRHFTTAMHAARRLPVFAATNIDGSKKPEGAMPNRPSWSIDPRIDEAHQPDDSIFSTMVHRGHLAARDFIYWGADKDEMKQADVHSFTLTNVCPQIRKFNAHKEWYELERLVMAGAEAEQLRVTELVGPILRATDPAYDDLRSTASDAETGTGIRIPIKFWKIVAWVENGELNFSAFILDQHAELEAAGPLEMALTPPAGVTPSTVEEIADLTDLEFTGFEQA